VRRLSILARLAALVLLAVAAACTERIESGAACPELCPTENVPVRDTTLDAVVFDSVLSGYPGPGEQALFLLAAQPRPDSLDVRAVVRFDSLPARYFPAGAADSVQITQVDSGFITLHLDTTGTLLTQAATISAYDVDTVGVGNDTSAATINRLFRPDRLIGAVQKNDLPTLLQHASPQMKEGLTQQLLDSVSKDLSPHLQKGYTATYLGDLHQRGVRVLLWKLTFKDGRDDALVRVAMQGEDVAGFFIQ